MVDDGSRDGTGRKARRHGARVATHLHNLGYGAALATGLRAARTPWVALVDGDGQFPLEAVVRLWQARGGVDAVWGVRGHRADPLLRRAAGAAWRVACRAALGIRLRDVDCGAKLVRREAVPVGALRCTGAGASAELAALLRRLDCRVAEVVVPHLPREGGEASGLQWRVVVRGVGELFEASRRFG